MRRVTLVALTVSALMLAAPAAAARTVDVGDLISDLDEIAAGYDVDVSDVDVVRLTDGTEAGFDPGVLDASTSREDAAAQAAASLAVLDSGAADDVEPERARSTARQVVDELDLEEEPPPDPPDMPRMSPFGALGQVLGYAVAAAALIGIGLAIAALVRSMSGRAKADDDKGETSVETSSGVLEDETSIGALSADEWTARAATAEAEGRYGDAVRFLHYAGLLRLDEDGTVAFDPSRTNRGYVDVTTALSPDTAGEVVDLNRLMEDATYGHLPAEPGAVGHTRSGWQRVRDTLRTAARSNGGRP